jgi:probable HAF family extracellular repeat protein
MRKAALCIILLTVAMFLAGAISVAAAPAYTYKDLHLGTGFFSSYAYGLNNAGQVVGWARTQSGDRAWIYSGGVMQVLGTLPGPYNFGSYAYGINATGQVVGYSASSSSGSRAFQWSSGDWTDLGILTGAPNNSQAFGINDAGQVVGCWNDGQSHAFLYTPGVGMENLDTLPGGNYNLANAINNAGQVAGNSDTSTDTYDHRTHAFLYTPGAGMQDLGAFGEVNYSSANGLNNTGKVVGWTTTTTVNNAFLWSGHLQALGSLTGYNSTASAINSAGQVVGGAETDEGRYRAFLYSAGVMQDLTSLVQELPTGQVIVGAGGINDRGQIAANSIDGHAFLLTPVAILSGLDLLLLD